MENSIKIKVHRIRRSTELLREAERNLVKLKKEHQKLDLLIFINEKGITKCLPPDEKKVVEKKPAKACLEDMVEKMSKKDMIELLEKMKARL